MPKYGSNAKQITFVCLIASNPADLFLASPFISLSAFSLLFSLTQLYILNVLIFKKWTTSLFETMRRQQHKSLSSVERYI